MRMGGPEQPRHAAVAPKWGHTAPWEEPLADDGPSPAVAGTGRFQYGFPVGTGNGEEGQGRREASSQTRLPVPTAPASHRPFLSAEPLAPPAAGRPLRDALLAPPSSQAPNAILTELTHHRALQAELCGGLGLHPQSTIR